MSIPLHHTELNRNHTFRYLEPRIHSSMNSNSKPVLPIYSQPHQIDPHANKVQRGRDSRDELKCHRGRLQRDKENSSIIMDRPLQ